MSEGDRWLVMLAAAWAVPLAAAILWRSSHAERAAMIATAMCCVLMTGYVIVFEPDPQAPIFLFMFFAMAALAGMVAILSFRVGRWVNRVTRRT